MVLTMRLYYTQIFVYSELDFYELSVIKNFLRVFLRFSIVGVFLCLHVERAPFIVNCFLCNVVFVITGDCCTREIVYH